MKSKVNYLLFFLALFALVLLVGCGKEYNVSFVTYNDQTIDAQVVKEASEIVVPVLQKEGYELDGWYLDSEFKTKFNEEYALDNDIVLYAKWNDLYFDVKFFVNGNEIDSQKVKYGANATAPADPTIEGHDFDGWDKAFDDVKSNLEVNATFKAKTYVVKFMDGTKELSAQNVEYGKAATAPTNLEKAGYTFKNWDKAFDNITNHLIVNAVYEANTINISYYDGDVLVETDSFKYGEAPLIATFSKTYYIFAGWYKDKAFLEEVKSLDELTADTSLYALAVTVKYYDGANEITTLAQAKFENEELIVPDYSVSGFVFVGWFLDNKYETPLDPTAIVLREDLNLYALLLEVDYNGGANSWVNEDWGANSVSNGIDPISTLPEEYEKDFYKYLKDEGLLASTLLGEGLKAESWDDFSGVNKLHSGDPQRVWNDTVLTKADSTSCGYSALFLYDEIELDDNNNLVNVSGGFLGSEPYRTKYFNLLQQLIVLYNSKYNVDVKTGTPTSRQLFAYVIDGYFYGTQSVTSSSKAEFVAFRTAIPTTTKYYTWDGSKAVEHEREYVVTTNDLSVSTLLAVPFKTGSSFAGWYSDSTLQTKLDDATITNRMKVYAKWE